MATQDESSPTAWRRAKRSRSNNGESSIKSRLTWAMVIPWIVVGVLWAVGCSLFAFDAVYTQQVGSGVRQISLPAVSALDSVQRERQLSLEYASQPGIDPAELTAQQNRTDEAVSTMREETAALLDSAPSELREPMSQLDNNFDRLPDIRSGIASGALPVNEINEYYDGLFANATQLFETQARIVPDNDTLQGATSAASLFRASDLASREASMINTAVNSDDLSPQQYRQLISYISTYHSELASAADNMRPEVQQRFDQLRSTPSWQRVVNAENEFIEAGSGGTPPINGPAWNAASEEVLDGLADMVRMQADAVSAQAVEKGNEALRSVLIGSLAALLVAIVSFLAARRVYRTVVDEALLTRLQDLRTESLELAKRLPDLVRRIRDGQQIDPSAEMTRLRRYGDDEVGQVANAIQVFHEEAVTAAVRETKARRGARAVFVGMAYRVQQLLRNMHGTIDDLERYEENSTQLGRLYDLDNSTTRARRKVENLLVLGDQQPGRRWSKPVGLLDVLRASVSEIDQYSRVSIGHVPDVSLVGSSVGDTIHLLSELVDNATAFSPPETEVHLNASLVARGVAVDIADQGLGMDETARSWANGMMAHPPRFDQLVLENNRAEQLGLFTTARLAERRSVSVEFGVSAYGGTRATVLLGQHILASRNEDDLPTSSVVPTTQQALPESAKTKPAIEPATSGADTDTLPWTHPTAPGWPTEEPAAPPAPPAEMADEPTDSAGTTSSASFSTTGSLPVPEAGDATRSAEADDGSANDVGDNAAGGRPPLPRRVPQSHLVAGLRDEPDEETDDAIAAPSRLAAFGRAFRSGVSNDESS